MKTPQDVTDPLLSLAGVPRTDTPAGRIIEQAAGGAANAFTGAGAVGQLAKYITSPLGKAVANVMAEHKTAQAVSGAAGGGAGQGAAELGAPGWAQQLTSFIAALAPGSFATHKFADTFSCITRVAIRRTEAEGN